MRLAVPAAALALVAALAGCHAGPAVSVSPDGDLLDGQQVAVRGGGYGAGADIGVVQCPAGADSIDDCDGDTAETLSADGEGHFDTAIFVKRVITDAHGVRTDCTAGGCVVASTYIHGFHGLATAPLTFSGRDGLSVRPDRDLVDQQTVVVTGRTSVGSAKVMQCPRDIVDYTMCDMRTLQYPGGAEYSVEMTVHRVIRDSSGRTTDCSVPGACMIISDLGHGWTIHFPQWAPIAFGR